MKSKPLIGAVLFFALAAPMFFAFQNCSKLKTTNDASSVVSGLVPVSSTLASRSPEFLLDIQPNELVVGQQVKVLGIFPTTTLSNETIDPDRFKMMLKELQGRTNMISILYVSEQALALAQSKGLVTQRKLSALALFEEKISIAEELGFSVAVELTPVFFDFDVNTLKYDLRKFKNNYQSEWAGVSAVIKKHSKTNWFYPFDEPYWAAKTAGISYSTMKSYLDQMNSLIKTDFPMGKIVFIEAFIIMNENFQIPQQADYVGMDCYGNFDNCYGESIPSYYNKLASKMTDKQKFIIIPDAFDFKGGDENGSWQNNVINQSKKYLAYSRQNPRVEAIIFFLYSSPLDKNLNVENLASTRQGSLLNLYFDQVSLQNQSVIGNSVIANPNVNISYLDKNANVVNIQTTDQNPNISISPKEFFDMSFSRPLSAGPRIDCTVYDPDGLPQKCDDLVFRQARYSSKDLKKGEWLFKFKLNTGYLVERRITLNDSLPVPVLKINCPTTVLVGSTNSCTATSNVPLATGHWSVNGENQPNSDQLTYTWSNIPGPAVYRVQGFATDTYGRSFSSQIISVSAVLPKNQPQDIQLDKISPQNNYRFYNRSTGEHFVTSNYNEGVNAGYLSEGVAFRSFSASTKLANTIKIYRCYNQASAKHFVSIDGAKCEGQLFEGELGQIYSIQLSGSIPLYRFYNIGNGDYLTTTNYSEGINAGYVLKATLGYVE